MALAIAYGILLVVVGICAYLGRWLYHSLKRNRDLRRQIQELCDGHHCDADEWKDITRQLAERSRLLKELEDVGLFFRQNYTEKELEEHTGKTLCQVIIMRLRNAKEAAK